MEGISCEAKNVDAIVRDWEEWELLVPGLMVGEKEGTPIFEDAWVSIKRIWTFAETVNFSLRDGPGWIGYHGTTPVRVREGT
jgi:hypothetical protein